MTSPSNAHVLIIHEADDYASWKRIFDDAAAMREKTGEMDYHLLAYAAGDRRLVHFSHWVSLDAARRFFESP